MDPFVDDFTRDELGTAPNGEPYENTADWEIYDLYPALVPFSQAEPHPLVWDTYRSDGTFTLEHGDSIKPVGLVLRWQDDANYVFISRYFASYYVFKYVDGQPLQLHGWGPPEDEVADDLMPPISGTGPALTVTIDGPEYTVKVLGTVLGTFIDTNPAGHANTHHGVWAELVISGPGSPPSPPITRMTAAFDLTDHIAWRAGIPESTRPPLTADHIYLHPGTTRGLLYKLPTQPHNLAPVGLDRQPIDLRIAGTGGPFVFVDDDGHELADDDYAPLIFD